MVDDYTDPAAMPEQDAGASEADTFQAELRKIREENGLEAPQGAPAEPPVGVSPLAQELDQSGWFGQLETAHAARVEQERQEAIRRSQASAPPEPAPKGRGEQNADQQAEPLTPPSTPGGFPSLFIQPETLTGPQAPTGMPGMWAPGAGDLYEVGRGAGVAASQIPGGAISGVGSVLQAPDVVVSGAQHAGQASRLWLLGAMGAIDRGEPVAFTSLPPRAGGGQGDPQEDDRRRMLIARYQRATPEQRALLRTEIQAEIAAFNPTPIQDRTLYSAGAAVQEYGRTLIPLPEGYTEQSFSVQLGRGLGSMITGLPATWIGGPAGGALVFGPMGMGEATQRAVRFDQAERAAGRPGLTQEQIIAAGLLGIGPGMTDILPVETLLGRLPLPIPPALRTALARSIARVGGQAIVEGAQEGGQQFLQNLIAWQVYNPNQVLTEEIIPNLLVGSAVGAVAQGAGEVGRGVMGLGRRTGRAGTPSAPSTPEAAPAPTPTPTPSAGEAAAQPTPGAFGFDLPVTPQAATPEAQPEAATAAPQAEAPTVAPETGTPPAATGATAESVSAAPAPQDVGEQTRQIVERILQERPDAVSQEETEVLLGIAKRFAPAPEAQAEAQRQQAAELAEIERVVAENLPQWRGEIETALQGRGINIALADQDARAIAARMARYGVSATEAIEQHAWEAYEAERQARATGATAGQAVTAASRPSQAAAAPAPGGAPAASARASAGATAAADAGGRGASAAAPTADARPAAAAPTATAEPGAASTGGARPAGVGSERAGPAGAGTAEQSRSDARDGEPAAQPITEPTTAQRQQLRGVLASRFPLNWGTIQARLGTTPEQMEVLRQEALNEGLLRQTKDGAYRRTPQAPITPAGPDLSVSPQDRVDGSIRALEVQTGRQVSEVVRAYATELLSRLGLPSHAAVLDRAKADKSLKAADVRDLAAIAGTPVAKNAKKDTAFASIAKRSEDHRAFLERQAVDASIGASLASFQSATTDGQSQAVEFDALGYHSKALEAAKAWPQKKGTPEQALQHLLKAGTGVKNEIEALGLTQFLESKSVPKFSHSPEDASDSKTVANATINYENDADAQAFYRALKALEKPHQVHVVPVSTINLDSSVDDGLRPSDANAATPVILLRMPGQDKLEVLDGAHRTRKAIDAGATEIRASIVEYRPGGRSRLVSAEAFVSRDDLVSFLRENRVEVREARYGGDPDTILRGERDARGLLPTVPDDAKGPAKWSSHSLAKDDGNPTYRETVLHLPTVTQTYEQYLESLKRKYNIPPGGGWGNYVNAEERARLEALQDRGIEEAEGVGMFRSGHFPEPNVISNIMSSLNKLGDETTFAVSQVQSDWGQEILKRSRDAVATSLFDPSKPETQTRIANLKERHKAAVQDRDAYLMGEPLTWLRSLGPEMGLARDEDANPDVVARTLNYVSQNAWHPRIRQRAGMTPEALSAKAVGFLDDQRNSLPAQLDLEAIALGAKTKRYRDLPADLKSEVSAAISSARQRGEIPAGARDERKIQELQDKWQKANDAQLAARNEYMASLPDGDRAKQSVEDAQDRLRALSNRGDPIGKKWAALNNDAFILHAELRTAQAATPSHPFVNTTDAWLTFTLKHVIRQAIASGADSISIPSGATVLSYNPQGSEEGNEEFYDKIAPLTLAKILKGMDASIKPKKVDHVQSPVDGRDLGSGFTVFPITDKVREQVQREGLALFALSTQRSRLGPEDGREAPTLRYFRPNEQLPKASEPGRGTLMAIERGGKQIGYVDFAVESTSAPDDTAYINYIKVNPGERLSLSDIRALREEFRREHPTVIRFEGFRVSGAKGRQETVEDSWQTVVMAALEEGQNPPPYTEAFAARLPEFVAHLERWARKMLPPEIAVRVVDRIDIGGRSAYANFGFTEGKSRVFDRVLQVALNTDAGATSYRTMLVKGFHEVVHALREHGRLPGGAYGTLLTPQEWQVVVERAKKIGIDSQITVFNHSTGKVIPGVPIYRQVYRQMMRETGFTGNINQRVEELIDQERVARLAELWADGTSFGTKIDSWFERIVKFFEAIRNALNGLGFQTYNDVFRSMASGETASRAGRREPTFDPFPNPPSPSQAHLNSEEGQEARGLFPAIRSFQGGTDLAALSDITDTIRRVLTSQAAQNVSSAANAIASEAPNYIYDNPAILAQQIAGTVAAQYAEPLRKAAENVVKRVRGTDLASFSDRPSPESRPFSLPGFDGTVTEKVKEGGERLRTYGVAEAREAKVSALEPAAATEIPVRAAIRMRGHDRRIFEDGEAHADIAMAASRVFEQENNEAGTDAIIADEYDSGFTTSAGRFVERREAFQLADAAGALPRFAYQRAVPLLDSMDLPEILAASARSAPSTSLIVSEQPDGSWELTFFRAEDASSIPAIVAAIEANDLGKPLSHKGWLTPQGYQYWLQVAPDRVKFHVNAGEMFGGMWASPRAVEFAEAVLAEAVSTGAVAEFQKRLLREARDIVANSSVGDQFRIDDVYFVGSRAAGKPRQEASDYDFVVRFDTNLQGPALVEVWDRLTAHFDGIKSLDVDGKPHRVDVFVTDELESGKPALPSENADPRLSSALSHLSRLKSSIPQEAFTEARREERYSLTSVSGQGFQGRMPPAFHEEGAIARLAQGEIDPPTGAELAQAAADVRAREFDDLVQSFGGDRAKAERFQRLFREAERATGARADALDVEREALAAEAVANVEGSYEDASALDGLARTFRDMEDHPQEVAAIIQRYLSDLPLPHGYVDTRANVALAVMRKAAAVIEDHGLDSKAITAEAVNAYRARFSDPEDAQFMVDALKAALAPKPRQLPGQTLASFSSTPPLDMSPEARKARAEEMGFDTSRVWYHGTAAAFDQFKPGLGSSGIYMTTDLAEASRYAGISARAGGEPSVMPLYIRTKRLATPADNDQAEADLKSQRGVGYVSSRDVNAELTRRGFDGYIEGDLAIVFDPANIRSVDAAFDPSQEGSPVLLASFQGQPPPGNPPPGSGAPMLPTTPASQGEVRGLADIISDLKSALGMTTTQGLYGMRVRDRAGGRTWGFRPQRSVRSQYDANAGVARVRIATDIDAIARAGGNHIERVFGAPMQAFLQQHAEELGVPPVPDTPLPQIAPTGYSGVDLDADTQRTLVEAAEATRAWQAVQNYDNAARAAIASRTLERRLGRTVAQALIGDIIGTQPLGSTAAPADPAGLAAYVQARYSPTGTPAPRTAPTVPPAQLSQAFAEFFRRYITDPDTVKREMPGVFVGFEEFLDAQDPAMLQDLERVQLEVVSANYKAYRLATATERLTANVASTRDPTTLQQIQEFYEVRDKREVVEQWLGTLSYNVMDLTNPALKMQQHLQQIMFDNNIRGADGRPITFRKHDLPHYHFRMFPQAFKIGHELVVNGVTDYGSLTPSGPPLTDAIQEAMGGTGYFQWSEKNLDRFGGYIEAQTGIVYWALWAKRHNKPEAAQWAALVNQYYNSPDIAQMLATLDSAPSLESEPSMTPFAEYWQAIQDIEQANPRYRRGSQMAREWLHRLLTLKWQAGLMTDEAFQRYSKRREFYSPFNRKFDAEEGAFVPPGVSALGTFGGFKQIKGSQRPVVNVLATMARDAYATAEVIQRNDMVRAFANLSDTAGPGGGQVVERITKEETLPLNERTIEKIAVAIKNLGYDEADARAMALQMEGDIQDNELHILYDPTHKGKGAILLPFFEKGERKLVRFNDVENGRRLLAAMNTLGRGMSGALVEMVAAPAAVLRAGVILHPAYMLGNVAGDMQMSWWLTGAPPIITHARGAWHELSSYPKFRAFMQMFGIKPSDVAQMQDRLGLIGGGQLTASIAERSGNRRNLDLSDLRNKGYQTVDIRAVAGTGTSLGGAAAGATLGTVAGPVVGGLVGGSLGGAAGASIGGAIGERLARHLRGDESIARLEGQLKTARRRMKALDRKSPDFAVRMAELHAIRADLMFSIQQLKEADKALSTRIGRGLGKAIGGTVGALSGGLGGVVAAPAVGPVVGATLGFSGGMMAGRLLFGAGAEAVFAKVSEFTETAGRRGVADYITRQALGTPSYATRRALQYDPNLPLIDAMREGVFTANDVLPFDRRGFLTGAIMRMTAFFNGNVQAISKAYRQTWMVEGDRGRIIQIPMLEGGLLGAGGAAAATAVLGGPVGWAMGAGALTGAAVGRWTMGKTDIEALKMWGRHMLRRRGNPGPTEFESMYSKADERTMRRGIRSWVILSIVAAMGASISMLNGGGDDPEEYADNNREVKNTHWVFKMFGVWVRLKRFEFGMPAIITEALMDLVRRGDPRAAEKIRDGIVATHTPPLTPQVLRDWEALRYGVDARTGRPLTPFGLRELPPYMRHTPFSSEFARQWAEALNGIGIQASPVVIDYALNSQLGYWGREVQLFSNYLGRGPRTDDWREVPIIGPMVNRFTWDPYRSTESILEVRRLMRDGQSPYVQAAAGYNQLMRDGANADALRTYLVGLSPDRTIYSVLMQHFPTRDRIHHPLNRAQQIDRVLFQLRREMAGQGVISMDAGTRGTPIALSPALRTQVENLMQRITAIEMYNALRDTGVPGWAGRPVRDPAALYRELQASHSGLYEELLRRFSRNRLEDDVTEAPIGDYQQDRARWIEIQGRVVAMIQQENMLGLQGAWDRKFRDRRSPTYRRPDDPTTMPSIVLPPGTTQEPR